MTVVVRHVISTPVRTASDTWGVISKLLAPKEGAGRNELTGIEGIACSLIVSESPLNDPIVVWGNGPRVRVYCLFGDDAITGEDKNEDSLVTCPTTGDWSMSLPCPAEDLAWVQKELASRSTRITARKIGDVVPEEEAKASAAVATKSVDKESFFRP